MNVAIILGLVWSMPDAKRPLEQFVPGDSYEVVASVKWAGCLLLGGQRCFCGFGLNLLIQEEQGRANGDARVAQ